MNKPFEFKNIAVDITLPHSGGDYLEYDISNKMIDLFGDKVEFSTENKYIFYPNYSKGEIGLLYYINKKSKKRVTYYFGWETCLGFFEPKLEYYLFDKTQYTNSYKKAEEQMIKAILFKKWDLKEK